MSLRVQFPSDQQAYGSIYIYNTMKVVCQVDFPNIFKGDLGAGDRSLNLHLAFGELVKLLSAPAGRYRVKKLVSILQLEAVSSIYRQLQ